MNMMVPDKANNNFCPIELKKPAILFHYTYSYSFVQGWIKRQSTVIETLLTQNLTPRRPFKKEMNPRCSCDLSLIVSPLH